jgi:hypothetical protein
LQALRRSCGDSSAKKNKQMSSVTRLSVINTEVLENYSINLNDDAANLNKSEAPDIDDIPPSSGNVEEQEQAGNVTKNCIDEEEKDIYEIKSPDRETGEVESSWH